jgi:hypothetical protein
MINEWWIGKNLKGSACCKNKSTKKSLNFLLAKLKHSYERNTEDEIKKIMTQITVISKESKLDSVTVCIIVMKLHCKNCELFCCCQWKCNKCITYFGASHSEAIRYPISAHHGSSNAHWSARRLATTSNESIKMRTSVTAKLASEEHHRNESTSSSIAASLFRQRSPCSSD